MTLLTSFNDNKPKSNRMIETMSPNKYTKNPTGWIPAGDSINIKGYEIGGMVYVDNPPEVTNLDNQTELSKAYIDPAKNVSRTQFNDQGEFVPFATSYSKMDSASRASYLKWLANGRTDTNFSPSYYLMYFLGLERRYMLDDSSEDEKKLIVQEVKRILELMPKRKLKPYLNHFLSFLEIIENTSSYCYDFSEEVEGNLPFNLKAELGCVLIEEEGRFTSLQMLNWFLHHNESQFGTAAEKFPEEFCELFRAKLDKRKPNGIKIALHPNQQIAPLVIEYYSASEEFVTNVGLKHKGKQVPDISEFKEPHTFVQKLADEVENNLSNYVQFCTENRNARNKVEAIALLPLALRKTRTIKGLRKYLNWANQVMKDGGVSTAGEAIALIEGKKSTTIYREQWEKTTNLFALAGFGLAPDTSLFHRPVKSGIPAVIFNLEEREKFVRVNSDQYRFMLTKLALGSYILHASGENSQSKLEAYKEVFSKISELSEHETKSISANFKYLTIVPPDQSFFQRIQLELTDDQKLALRAVVVEIAKVAGTLKTTTVSALETFYEALKIERQFAYSDLHAGEVVNPSEIVQASAVTEDAPKELSTIWTETKVVETSNPTSNQEPAHAQVSMDSTPKFEDKPIETVPIDTNQFNSEQNRPKPVQNIQETQIEQREKTETDANKMSSVLNNLLSKPKDFNDEPEQPKKTTLAGLDEKQTKVVKTLVEHRFWPESKFLDIVKRNGYEPVSLVKKLNEWAYFEYNGPLIEVNNGYHVESQMARILKRELQNVL